MRSILLRLGEWMAAFAKGTGAAWRVALVATLAAAVMAVLALERPSPAPAQQAATFRIGTGPSDSTYFAIGGLLASAISNPSPTRSCETGGSCGVPGLIATAVSTEGALPNLESVAAGRLESGLVQGDVAYWAHVGRGPFEGRGKVGGLATIAALNPETVHLVARRALKVKRIHQLSGRRISIGTERSATPLLARSILQAYGVPIDRAKISQESPARAAELMQKGQLDAFFVVAGQPVAVIADLAERMEIDIVPIKGKQAEGLILSLPFLTRGQIEAGHYKGAGGVPTLAMPAQWIVSSKADPELVYGITKALWHNNMRQLLDTRHPDGKRIRRETAMQGVFIPLHPGAERYYRETGVLN